MEIGDAVKVKESICICGYKLDACSSANGNHTPKSGDISICIKCGHIMAFDHDMSLRDLTNEEMYEIAGDPVIIAVQKARKGLK